MTFHAPNKFRLRNGRASSDDSIGNAGAFEIKLRNSQRINLTKTAQVRMCGNSVCPPLAAALVRANLSDIAITRRAA